MKKSHRLQNRKNALTPRCAKCRHSINRHWAGVAECMWKAECGCLQYVAKETT